MRIREWVLLAFMAVVVPAAAYGQHQKIDHNFHGWFNYFGDHPIGRSKWGVHLEGQWRRHDGFTRWQQLLLRPALNYEVSPLLMLSAGYGFARSFPYGEYPAARTANEHRLWQQAWFRYRTGRVAWTTRLRFENRFLHTINSETGRPYYRFENRFRGWQQVRVPVSDLTYFTAYNELWFYVKPYVSNSAFDQNRAYAAIGVNVDRFWRMELGYMNQALLQRSGAALESNHTLMISVFSTAAFWR